MLRRSFPALLLAALAGCASHEADRAVSPSRPSAGESPAETVALDPYTQQKLTHLLAERATVAPGHTGAMIERLSRGFLGTPYRADMLRGSAEIPEELVIDFRGLDCFTYLDYVEALRHSASQSAFIRQLIRTRYIDGKVAFLNRKHFFTDWAYRAEPLARDITAQLSPNAVRTGKNLNQKDDGGVYLPGLPVVKRSITYIPREFIDDGVVSRLRTGDFIGIYTKLAGLDVTHVGFFILTENGPVLRNASSLKKNEKVVDSPFMDYVSRTPGIVVLRPLN